MERRRAQRFGWTWLLLWACVGVSLEVLHAWKVPGYLEDETTRLLLRLAHAHGVGLSLVVLVYASAGAPLLEPRTDGGRGIGRLLRAAAALIPLGFGLGAVAHPEGDPSLGILLVPIGALALLVGLARIAWAAWRS